MSSRVRLRGIHCDIRVTWEQLGMCHFRLFYIFTFVLLATTAGIAAELSPPDQLPEQANLPDPLVMRDGTKVTTKEEWETKRKPELKELFQHYMYGQLPPAPKQVKYTTLFTDEKALGGKAKLSEVKI